MHPAKRFWSIAIFLCIGGVGAGFTCLSIAHRPTPADSAPAQPSLGLMRLRSPEPSPQRDQSSQAERIERMQQRIAALESTVTALAKSMNTEQGTLPVSTVPQPAESRAAISEAEADQQRQRGENQLFARIDDNFASQTIDSSWSASMTARINAAMAEQGLTRSTVEQVECRTSICRVAIRTTDRADLEAFSEKLRASTADVLSADASTQDETGRFIVYLASDPQALNMAAN